MVDYIADYLENIRDRRVFPDVKPGYMRDLVPENAPMEGEKWENIFNDVETVIMPGVISYLNFKKLFKESGFLGDTLAKSIYARLLPRLEQLSFTPRGHVS